MKKVTIVIETENAAFADGPHPGVEVASILDNLAEDFRDGALPHVIRDSNGNRVGTCEIEHAPEEVK